MAYLKILADEELYEGRRSGTPTGNEAFVWIADRFTDWGLQPFLNDKMLVPYSQLASEEIKSSLTLNDSEFGKVQYQLGDDYIICGNSGSGKVTAPVALVGRGVTKPEKGWDDYADVDVKGRIVIIFRGNPAVKGQDWNEEAGRSYRYPEAIKQGAVAVFFYDRAFPINGPTINEKAYNPDIPVGYVGDHVMNHLLAESGISLKEYKKNLGKGPNTLLIDKEMTFNVKMNQIKDAFGYNVVGMVPGTDPKLSKEVIFVGAHGDHAGPNALGHVYPGADDNGSGTVTIMELARTFVNHPQKRTLVFGIWGAEEQGLLGSRAFAAQLPEGYDYINYVNLDMCGRGSGKTNLGGSDALFDIWNPWYDSLPVERQELISSGRAWGGESSDHAPFRNLGIPAFTGSSSGNHDFYHSKEDRYETIHPEAIEGTLITFRDWMIAIASHDTPIADKQLYERTIWHRGYPFVFHIATGEPALDLPLIRKNLEHGLMIPVLEIEVGTGKDELLENIEVIDRYYDAFGNDKKIKAGKSFSEVGGNSYYGKATTFISLAIDNLQNADTTSLEIYHDLGINWIKLNDPDKWIHEGSINPNKDALIEVIKDAGFIVENENPTELPVWDAVINAVPGQVHFNMGWKHFARSFSTDAIEEYSEMKCRFIVKADKEALREILEKSDWLITNRIHIQPDSENYNDILDWVHEARLQADFYEKDDKTLLKLIGGNMRLW